MPLNAVGKIDRAALPAPKFSGTEGARAPLTEMETSIALIWREVLGSNQFGIDDNFFDAGGTSLSIARLEAELRSRLNLDVSITHLFQYPTIHALASHLSSQTSSGITTMSEAQQRARQQKAAQNAAMERRRQNSAAKSNPKLS